MLYIFFHGQFVWIIIFHINSCQTIEIFMRSLRKKKMENMWNNADNVQL